MLEVLLQERRDMRLTELASSVGLAPSTASRLLATLEREGVVERTPSRGWRLTSRWRALWASPPPFPVGAADLLAELAAVTQETVAYVVRSGNLQVVRHVVESTRQPRVSMAPGLTIPLLPSIAGFALLIGSDPREFEAAQANSAEPRLDDEQARQLLDLATEHDGLAVVSSRSGRPVCSLAVPVRVEDEVVGAISVVGPAERFGGARLRPAFAAVKRTRDQLAGVLASSSRDSGSAVLVESA